MSKYFTKNGRTYITESMIRSENQDSRIPEPMTDAHAISLGYQVQAPTEDELAQQARNEFKSARQAAVESIIVTTSSGLNFDGNETSQGRMGRAITALRFLASKLTAGEPIDLTQYGDAYTLVDGVYRTVWVLADNTKTYLTAEDLEEALALSGASQAALWVTP